MITFLNDNIFLEERFFRKY